MSNRTRIALLVTALTASSARADVTLDGKFGPKVSVELPGAPGRFIVDQRHGRVSNRNLFHSFEMFSLDRGQQVEFTGDPSIQNVLSRVTGRAPSQIAGRIVSGIPGASFFFLNPAGIVFTDGAELQIDGATHVSTADYLEFGSSAQQRLYADPSMPSVLSELQVSAFGFLGAAPAALRVLGDEDRLPLELGLRGGSFIGGDIDFRWAKLRSPGGRIDVVSAGSAGRVLLGGDPLRSALDTSDLARLGSLELDRSSLDVSGVHSGAISIQAGSIAIESSALAAMSWQTGVGGGIWIDGTEGLEIGRGSRVQATAFGDGLGPRIDLRSAGSLLLNEASIEASVDGGAAAGGDIEIHAGALTLRDALVRTRTTNAVGHAGAIEVRAADAVDLEGSRLESLSEVSQGAPGSAALGGVGDVSVWADSVTAKGASRLGTLVDGPARGHSSVDVRARRVRVLEGAELGSTFTQFHGDFDVDPQPSAADVSSSVQVRGSESVEVSGFRLRRTASDQDHLIRSAIRNDNTHGLDHPDQPRLLRIDTPQLRIAEGGSVSSTTLGRGNSGDIYVNVDDLLVETGGGLFAGSSGGLGRTDAGNAGSIRVRASDGVEISGQIAYELDGGIYPQPSVIESVTTASGGGGNVSIHARRLVVDEGMLRTISTAEPHAAPVLGDAGALSIEVDRLEVRNGGTVTAEAHVQPLGQPGKAGHIEIKARSTLLESESTISAGRLDVRVPTAGSIRIEGDTLELRGKSRITAESPAADRAGAIEIAVREVRVTEGSSISTNAQSDGGDLVIGPGDLLHLRDGKISTKGGDAGGNVTVESDLTVLQGESIITADGDAGRGGNVDVLSRAFIGDPKRVTAKSRLGLPGNVNLPSPDRSLVGKLAELPAVFLEAQKLLSPSCAVRDPAASASFVVAERRGVGSSPEGWLLAFDAEDAEPMAPVETGALQGALVASARAARTRAQAAWRAGDIATAQREFAAASASPEAGVRSRGLRGHAQAQQASGDYRGSIESLLEALLVAEAAGDAGEVAAALGSLSNAYVALDRLDLAEDHLRRALAIAQAVGKRAVAVQLQINQGNYLAMAGKPEEALASYREASALADHSGQRVHAVQALANAARLASQAAPGQADALLERARAELAALPPSHDKIYALVHVAGSELLVAAGEGGEAAQRLRAHAALMQAVQLGVELGAERASSYALGSLGALYERERRDDEALQAVQRALLAAEQAEAPESLYRLHAQAGRILARLGRRGAALEAHRRAVAIAEQLRPEAAPSYSRSQVSFRENVAPVYWALVDALLQEAERSGEAEQSQPLLLEARAAHEALRAAELRDYFRDDCLAALAKRERPLESVAADAAVVSPLLLPDRLELLVTLGGAIRRYTLPVPAARVAEQVLRLRRALQGEAAASAHLTPARQLYDWLVEPYAAELERAAIRTLVFVPDGALRGAPMAALHDGSDFLIRRFALAVTPGLSLTDPRPLERERLKVLVAGLSEGVQGFPRLPHVTEEVEAIRAMYSSTVLLDEQFTQAGTERALASEAFSVVHIASHGVFHSDAAHSFILTHEGRISMQELASWVSRTRYRDQPLELLVLSACETAAGDERAALGLAGVAIHSGARSALGSLWSIDDEAASRLVTAFYSELRNPELSRAQALQRAQLALLDSPQYRNPAHWSAFLLINSWL